MMKRLKHHPASSKSKGDRKNSLLLVVKGTRDTRKYESKFKMRVENHSILLASNLNGSTAQVDCC